MNYLQIMCPFSAFVLAVMFIGWLCRRRPYRDGSRESQPVTSSPVEPATPPHSQTVITETQTQFICVPCQPKQDWTGVTAWLNRQDTSTTDHRDQDDDHPGPSWGIIR
jgi:hypothetical protein